MDKLEYKILCKNENIPIFSQYWWLESICDDNWEILKVQTSNEIFATLPYVIQNKDGKSYITTPAFTQNLGIWYKFPDDLSYKRRLHYQKKLINMIHDKLPEHDVFIQKFHYSFDNWLPFYWNDYKQSTYYTYILEKIKDHYQIRKNFDKNIKNLINKASGNLKIKESWDVNLLFNLVKKTYLKKDLPFVHKISIFENIFKHCRENNTGKMFLAYDQDNNIHGAIFVAWDRSSAYYLFGGYDDKFKNSGSQAYLLWHAIKYCSEFVDTFDFEGSMVKSIERFFRDFGGVQKPYFLIWRNNSW